MADSTVTGVILCGGAGRRVGGEDKPLLVLDCTTLAARVIERVKPQVEQLVLSANRNLEKYRSFHFPVLIDRVENQGPLAGVAAAAAFATSDWMFVCPGDAPLVPVDLVVSLQAAITTQVDVVIPHDGRRNQHLFMLARRSSALEIDDYLAEGERSVRGWLNRVRVCSVPFASREGFSNVNSLEDLQALGRGGAPEDGGHP